MDGGVEEARKAMEVDPLSPQSNLRFASSLMYAGKISQARAELERAKRTWPNSSDILFADFGFNLRYGDPKLAAQEMSRALTDYSDAALEPFRRVITARINANRANVSGAIE